MGANTSDLMPEDFQGIQEITKFSPKQIKRLYKRFMKLDKDKTGTLSNDELMAIPELAINPLIPRVLSLLDNINFRDFLRVLSIFYHGDKQEKLQYVFLVYDTDCDGYISNDDLFQVLKMMCGNNLSDSQLHQVVAQTIFEGDEDHDGRLSYSEFEKVFAEDDILIDSMSVTF